MNGRYPVGANNIWHSGIHVFHPNDPVVYPVADADIVAFRIPEKCVEIDRCKEISEAQYEQLDMDGKRLYHEETTGILRKIYYQLNSTVTDKAKYANGFVVLKKTVVLGKTANKTQKSLDFFILCANLSPLSDSNNTEYELAKAPKKAAFFQKYMFTVTDAMSCYYYKTGKGNYIYELSACTITGEEGNNYKCRFDQINEDVLVPKNGIALAPIWYKPAGADVPVYELTDGVYTQKHELLETAEFTGDTLRAFQKLTTTRYSSKVLVYNSNPYGIYPLAALSPASVRQKYEHLTHICSYPTSI
jgi:hypothetical protein